jgi:hypothetical protein
VPREVEITVPRSVRMRITNKSIMCSQPLFLRVDEVRWKIRVALAAVLLTASLAMAKDEREKEYLQGVYEGADDVDTGVR